LLSHEIGLIAYSLGGLKSPTTNKNSRFVVCGGDFGLGWRGGDFLSLLVLVIYEYIYLRSFHPDSAHHTWLTSFFKPKKDQTT